MCEIFKGLVGANFVNPGNCQRCPFEEGCSQTLEDCKMGDALVAIDIDRKDAAVTEEDKEQSRLLAVLEAEHAAKEAALRKNIQDRDEKNTNICVNRRN